MVQLTSPLFLFLFLPLALALFMLTPKRWRRGALTAISLAWLVLANYGNPWDLLHIALTVALAATLSRYVTKARVLAPIGAACLVLSLITSRLLAALCSFYSYPTGLLFITLSGISLLFDKQRGDTRQRDSLADVLCYLLFFPTATLGPAVRYKHFLPLLRKISPTPTRFCDGIRLYMLGFIKRIAVAAVFYRALDTVLNEAAEMPFIALPTALLLAFLLFYFFVSGCADMARGIAAMLGMRLPRDRANLLRATSPHAMLYTLFFSVHRYLEDYLVQPILCHKDNKRTRAATAVLSLLTFLMLLAPAPAAWLVSLPLLGTVLFSCLCGTAPQKRHPAWHTLLFLLSALCTSFPALVVAAGDPRRVLSLLRAIFDGAAAHSYTFYFVVPDLQYILIVITVFALLTLLTQLYHRYSAFLAERTCFAVSILSTALLFIGFLLSLLYMMPQFSQYALSPFGM